MGTRIPLPGGCENKTLAGLPQLLSDFEKLSDDHDSCDVAFLIGRDEDRVYGHKLILVARCKSFQIPNKQRNEICRIPGSSVTPSVAGSQIQIRLPHAHIDVFRQFMLYVYTGKVVLQDARVFEMMILAQEMGMEDLKLSCKEHVIATLSVTNACTFLTAAMEIQEKAIVSNCISTFMERCITFIGENAAECVKTNAFVNLTKEGLIKLISSDYFCLEEEDVWRCVLAWAKNQAGVTQSTNHWTEEERALVCQYLAGVMGHVRLLLIDSQVFAEEVEPTGAVPMELSLERYRHAALQTSKTPISLSQSMPSLPGGPLAENDKRLQPRLLLNMFSGSNILKNDKLHLQGVLNGWYGIPKQTWRLIFRASTHGYSAAAFHRHCDGIAPVFVIALGARGEISGGFSDVAWAKTSRKGGYIPSERAFLFALSNDPPTKYDIIKKPYAICYHPDCGPIFGAGADLLITHGCNTNMDSYSNLPHSYDGPNACCMSLLGDYNFSVMDYEVYTTTPPQPPATKAKQERI